jgi:pimeloyl-ACP methyl ester carboxylesterase
MMTASKIKNLLYHEIYHDPSNREWIVLVHGAGGSTKTWKRQIRPLGAEYNLIVIDLPGHGQNKGKHFEEDYSFQFIGKKLWEVIDHLQIQKVHLLGISLGAILCLQMRLMRPNKVLSLGLPGAIVHLNIKLRILARISLGFAKVIGYRNFYKLSALIMMPRGNHKKSRDVFIKESKALTNLEFKKWTNLYYNLNQTLIRFSITPTTIPHLLVMGSQDHLFMRGAKKFVANHPTASLKIIEKCGHVVSIEKADIFNKIYLKFLKERISATSQATPINPI